MPASDIGTTAADEPGERHDRRHQDQEGQRAADADDPAQCRMQHRVFEQPAGREVVDEGAQRHADDHDDGHHDADHDERVE
jgi:hypothetical protein